MSELTLKNIKIKNKHKTYSEWVSSWNDITPELGEVYVFQVRATELELNGITQAEYLHASLPIGNYTKTGDGSTTLNALPWDHNIAGFISEITTLDSTLVAKADKSEVENISNKIEANISSINTLNTNVSTAQRDIETLQTAITTHTAHPGIELSEIAGASRTFKLTYEAGALRFRFFD